MDSFAALWLYPIRRSTRPIARAKPFRYDALAPEAAGFALDDRAVFLDSLRTEQLGEQSLAFLDWLPPQIFAVTLAALPVCADGSRIVQLVLRFLGLYSLVELAKPPFPTIADLLPEFLVVLIDRMPCQFSAFFNLSLEEFFAV